MDITEIFLSLLFGLCSEVTEHALDEMDDDKLTMDDVIACCANGKVRRAWLRERKYEIEGRGIDGRPMRVIGRLTEARWLRIITVYAIR